MDLGWQFRTKFQEKFNYGLPTLIRQFKYKWWNKFDYSDILHLAVDHIPHYEALEKKALKAKEEEEIIDPIKSLKESLKRKYPNASKAEIQQKLLELTSLSDSDNEKDDVSMATRTIASDSDSKSETQEEESPEEFFQTLQEILNQEEFSELDTQPDYSQRIEIMERQVELIKEHNQKFKQYGDQEIKKLKEKIKEIDNPAKDKDKIDDT